MRRLFLFVWCATVLAAGPLPAQDGPVAQDCEIVDGEDLRVLQRGTPFERVILRGNAHIRCAGGVELKADTAISHTVTGRREFIGHVFYVDTVKSLTADRVDYEHLEARLLAVGDVVLTDVKEGSVIRGTELEYFRETPERPESRTVVRGRPHATLYERADSAVHDSTTSMPPEGEPESASAAVPLEIDADEMEIFGGGLFRAVGNVILERGETTGSAERAEFHQVGQWLLLEGDAMVEGEAYSLAGEWICGVLDGEELREVQARVDAVLLSEELRVDSPELHVFFEEGQVHRMVAMRMLAEEAEADDPAAVPALVADSSAGPVSDSTVIESGNLAAGAVRDSLDTGGGREEVAAGQTRAHPVPPEDPGVVADESAPSVLDSVVVTAPLPSRRTVGPQPRATSTEFWLMADSIDAIAPGQRLERVIAVGNAYGERTADSLAVELPEVIARDWLRGDTITGYFATVAVADSTAEASASRESVEPAVASAAGEEDTSPSDSTQMRTVLERLVAVGPEGRAQSLYRIREKDDPADPSVNFLVANRIVLLMQNGEVSRVEAEGPIKGWHLQPEQKSREPTETDSGVAEADESPPNGP